MPDTSRSDTFREGVALYRMRNYKDALSLFLSTDRINPDTNGGAGVSSLELAYYIGLCYARLNRYEEALLYLEQVVTASGSGSESETDDTYDRICQCRLTLAMIYAKTDRPRLARYELDSLMESGYQTVPTLNVLAFTTWAEGKQNEALELYKRALEIDENNPTALNGLGYCLACMNQDLTKALFYCKKALDSNPDSAAYLDSMAWVYFKMGLQKEALTFIRRAREKVTESSALHDIEEHLAVITQADVS